MPVAQLDSASDSDSEGRRFESCRAYHVVASFVSLATTFYALRQKSSRAHSAAPPFQIEPTSLGFDLVFSPQNWLTMPTELPSMMEVLHWLRKPPAMPVEVSRKKALASSIERSESRITIQRIRMHSIKTADARLRAAEHLMQVKNHSVHL